MACIVEWKTTTLIGCSWSNLVSGKGSLLGGRERCGRQCCVVLYLGFGQTVRGEDVSLHLLPSRTSKVLLHLVCVVIKIC